MGARRQHQQHRAQRDECYTEQVVHVHAVTAPHGHLEEDRVETRRVEPDDDGAACNGDNSEHPPQGSPSVLGETELSTVLGDVKRWVPGSGVYRVESL